MKTYIQKDKVNQNYISLFEILCIIMLLLFINVNSHAQIVPLGCQTEDVAVEDLERKDFETPSGSTAIHSQGSMHNFTLPPASDFGPCKIITNITVQITAIGVDLTNLPPDCIPTPLPYFYNIALGCPDFTPASCNTANLLGEPNTPTFTNQNLSFPGNFDFGENLSVDIVPVMNINCTAGQTSLTSDAVILDYEICVTVTVEDAVPDAEVELGPNLTICPGTTTTIDAGTFVDYLWGPSGSQNQTITVGEGTYNVTVTDNNNCTSTDFIIVSEFPDLDITFNPISPNVCDNGQVSVSVSEIYQMYEWSTGNSGQTQMLAPGNYDVTVTDNNNCTEVNSITVVNVQPPNAGSNNFVPVCNDGTLYNIDAELGIHDAGGTWTDNDASGININTNPTAVDFSNAGPGTFTYTYTVAGASPCPPNEAIITIEIFDQNNAGISANTQFCADPGFIDFSLLLSNPDAGGLWSDLNGSGVDLSNPFTVNMDGVPPGMYNYEYLFPANGPCSAQSAVLTITILNGAFAGNDNGTTVCEGTQFNLFDLVDGANDVGVFVDNDMSGALSGSIVNTSGLAGMSFNFTYIVGTMGSPCGQDEATFTLNIESSVSAGDDIMETICTDGDIDLFDILMNEDLGGEFLDNDMSGGLVGNILSTGSILPGTYEYEYQIGDGITCPQDISIITLTFLEEPTSNFPSTQATICIDNCDEISIDLLGTAPFEFPIQIYSQTSGELVATNIVTVNNDSYSFTTCNSTNGNSFINDTLNLVSDSSWFAIIPLITDANCLSNVLNVQDTFFINTVSGSSFTFDTTACITDTIDINGVLLFDGNSSFVDTIPGLVCDSIVNINVIFQQPDTSYINEIICPGDSILIEGLWFDEQFSTGQAGSLNENGCDTTIFISVEFYDLADTLIDLSFCSGDSIVINGITYNETNPIDTQTLPGMSSNGCDSIINISLMFTDNIPILIDDLLCFGDSIEIYGQVFDQDFPSGEIIRFGANGACDTIIDIDLSFLPEATGDLTGPFCPDFSIEINGFIYDIDNSIGSEVFPNASQSGCDSTLIINLQFDTSLPFDLTQSICDNDSIVVNGRVYNALNTIGTEVIPGADVFGCDSTININLTILETFSNTLPASICEGDSIFLEGDWQFNAGTYIDVFQSTNFCDSTITTVLTTMPCQVIVSLMSIDNNCEGDINGEISVDIQSTIDFPYTINWVGENTGTSGSIVIDMAQNPMTIIDLVSDNYTITILDSDGNNIYSESIIVNDLSSNIGGTWMVIDSILCEDGVGTIEFTPSGGATPYEYNWSDATIGNMPLAENLSVGEYSLTVTDLNGCSLDTSFTILNGSPFTASISYMDISCIGSEDGQISIFDVQGGELPFAITFNGTPVDSLTVDNLPAGTYEIEILDANNCLLTFSQELVALGVSDIATYTEIHTIMLGDSVILDGVIQVGNFTSEWLDNSESLSCTDCANPTATPTESTFYNLLITDEFGCSQSIEVFVEVEIIEVFDIVPNIFSPNGDGQNDEFKFVSYDLLTTGLSMKIFDRWGNLMHDVQSTGNEISWDGTKDGKLVTSGVYVFQIMIIKSDGTSDIKVGDATLVY